MHCCLRQMRRWQLKSAPTTASACRRASGEWGECEVLGSTYVMPFLTILNLRDGDSGALRRVTLLPDSLEADDFRQLRVWLRWKKDSAQS